MPRRRIQTYETDSITVTFDPNLCIHAARCLQSLPAVFDVGRRDWVRPAAAPARDVAEAVSRCPSGALQYIQPGEPDEAADAEVTFMATPNGPYHARGALIVRDAEGGVLGRGTRFALCRCGGTANAPFCDNTHRANGFRDR
jgi:uncharacterized Fe-S cluster protein YjdI